MAEKRSGLTRRVLIVAFQFPPFAGSSGVQRTLRFVQQLPQFGWEPVVLTASARAYETTSQDLLGEVPANTVVRRSAALDTVRHLSVARRYPAFLSVPDRWMTWRFSAVPAGRRLIRELQPSLIWSTFPIATAHAIAIALQAQTGLPWVADFRDPMAQEGYPENPVVWRSIKSIEEETLRHAARSVFCAPGAAAAYRDRYRFAADRICVIENGYDEESFDQRHDRGDASHGRSDGRKVLLHSGLVYTTERDPTKLFDALRRLKQKGVIDRESFCLRFRASSNDLIVRGIAERFGVADLIDLVPQVGYRAALSEMQSVDGLIVLQAASCNRQIPAKLYEYLRAGTPLLGLTDPQGDSAQVLRSAGIDAIAPLENTDGIERVLQAFLQDLLAGKARRPDAEVVAHMSRRQRSAELAKLFDDVAG